MGNATKTPDCPSNQTADMTFSSLHQHDRSSRPHGRLDPLLESPGQFALIAIVVWLIGVIIHPLAILAPVGLVLLLVTGAAYLVRPKKHTMYWRGREIDLDDDRSSAEHLCRRV